MHSNVRRGISLGAGALLCFGAAIGISVAARTGQNKAAAAKKPEQKRNASEAYRFNTLGVAHMNQQRPADAQK
ncbi:MAG TPA: hypothetical protein VHM93_08995, partial [Candidatus Acidoferrum sp.]|nr:hypothetical protein [Candidatus Acidoferrum sp.]